MTNHTKYNGFATGFGTANELEISITPSNGRTNDEDDLRKKVYEAMEPLGPYTTGELAGITERPRDLVHRAPDQLFGGGDIRGNELAPDRTIWIWEPPKHTRPGCGRVFELKHLPAVLDRSILSPLWNAA